MLTNTLNLKVSVITKYLHFSTRLLKKLVENILTVILNIVQISMNKKKMETRFFIV